MESEVFINTCSLDLCRLVKIDDLPSLVGSSVILPYPDCLSFNILSSGNIKYLAVVPVDELVALILEDLPPVGVG
jgi:hypothetical protein